MSYQRHTVRISGHESSLYTLELYEKSFTRMIDDIEGLPWWAKSSLPVEARVRLLQLWPLLYHAELGRDAMSAIMDSAAHFLKEQFCKEFFFSSPKAFEEPLEFRDGVDGEALPSAHALFKRLSSDETLDTELSETSRQDYNVKQFRKAS